MTEKNSIGFVEMWIRVFKSNRTFGNTRMNTKHPNTNRLQKKLNTTERRNQMNRVQSIECKVLKYKALKYLEI